MTRKKSKVLVRLGDVNPIDYGGGVVIDPGYGPQLEYINGLDEDPDQTEQEMYVYRADIEEDVLKWHDWVDAADIAENLGITVAELKKRGRGDLVDRALVTQEIGLYHGWGELDDYPDVRTAAEIERDWEL